jgi:hypothetical protein
MNRERLTEHIERHGIRRALLVYAFALLRQLGDFDILRVVTFDAAPVLAVPNVGPYETREIAHQEFRAAVHDLAWLDAEAHERTWAFERGDRCYANLLEGRLVGYTFFATRPTLHRPGLLIAFPEGLTYAYASYTHPEHRGMKLAAARSITRRVRDQAEGIQRRVVWAISLDNSSSLAASGPHRPKPLGYLGYLKLGSRYLCVASPACKKAGIYLVPMAVAPSA